MKWTHEEIYYLIAKRKKPTRHSGKVEIKGIGVLEFLI